MAVQVREDPVAPFRSQSRERADQDLLVPHCRPDLPFGHAFYNTRAVTALDRLATLRIARLPPRRRRALFRAVESAESAVELFHRHRAGARPVPHPIALTPFLVPRRVVPGLARLAALVHRLQAHAPALWRADVDGFRQLCPLSDATAAWVTHEAARGIAPWQLMIRP